MWMVVIAKWAALLPILMVVDYTIACLPPDPPMWLKLIISASIIVPTMEYLVGPTVDMLMNKYFGDDEAEGSKKVAMGATES